MKKTAFMIVYNDVDYVDYAIRSVKDWVDELIIVEGAFEITMKTGKPPRSDDGTLDIIHQHVDNKRVFLKQANLREHKHHYDIGYQYAIENGSDWAILVDSDEVWTPQSKAVAENNMQMYLKKGSGWGGGDIKEMRIKEYCFINDFKTYYKGTYPRFFKCLKGSKFVFDNEVQFAGYRRGEHGIFTSGDAHPKVFHYGYVRKKTRWQLKQDYMWEKDHNPNLEKYTLKDDSYVIPEDIPIYSFEGQHPEMMKDHPFYGKGAHEIIYDED